MKKKAEISEFAQFTDNVQFLIDHKNTIKKYEEVKKAVKDGLQQGFKHPAVFLKTIRPESEICVKGQDEVLLNLLAERFHDRLELLNPYQLDRFAIEDWLIPANTYTTGNKTPIDVILDVAQAAGGFVFSHRKNPTISIGYKWKTPAWQIDTATPDLIIPDDVIVSISGRYRITEQANGVFVYGTGNNAKGADVFRSATAREPRASALSHPLYTDEVVLRTAGIFALSETGRHKEETITLPVSAQDGIPCLDLGWLVQVNENNQLWRGVVESISINANVSNDGAISIMQTAGVDRYITGF